MAPINFKFISNNVKGLQSSNKHIKIFQCFKKKIAINEKIFLTRCLRQCRVFILYLRRGLKNIPNLRVSHLRPFALTLYKTFLKNKEFWNLSFFLIFCMIFEEKYFSCYILLTDQISLFHCLYFVRY